MATHPRRHVNLVAYKIQKTQKLEKLGGEGGSMDLGD